MSNIEWLYATQFAADLLYYGSPSMATTRVAIFKTADASNISTNALTFGAEPTIITINETLPNLAQTFQPDFYLQKSLEFALNLFTTSSSSSRRKILIIFAAKEFKQSPCKLNMRANEIYTYTIAIGSGWNHYPLICVGSSENNYEGLRSVATAADLQSILTDMEDIACPHHPLVKVTEIQLAGVSGEQYIELYNYGHPVTMSEFTLNGFASGPLPNVVLPTGLLGVIYNTDENYPVPKTAIPNCINCGCSEQTATNSESIKWCNTAIYMGCCDSNTAGSCLNNYGFEATQLADCQFNAGLSMTTFNIQLIWTNPRPPSPQITIQNITFDANQYWPTVATNYALELKNKGYNNQFGSSWLMSCDTDGTPGDDYGSVACSFDCDTDGNSTCDLSGGMLLEFSTNTSTVLEPGCVVSTGTCSCAAGYYAWYHTCLPLPAPSNCIATYISGSQSRATFTVAPWDGESSYTYFHCERNDILGGCTGGDLTNKYSETSTYLLNPFIYDPGRTINATSFALRALGSGGEPAFSQRTECAQVTGAPTTEPTPAPTYSVPEVPSCTITIQNLFLFDVVWAPIDMMQFNDTAAPNDTFRGYVYYYNGKRRSSPVPCCTLNGNSPPGTSGFNFSRPDVVSVSGDWDSTFTDVSTLDELLSATDCTVITLTPSSSPTSDPTGVPTKLPTDDPTTVPTGSPTLRELYVPSCAAYVLPRSNNFNMTWVPATFIDNTTALITDAKYHVEWFYADGSRGAESISADAPQRPVQVENYLNVTILQMYCSWNGGYQEGRRTNCSIHTTAPTPSPTNLPSSPPTKAPTRYPTVEPTANPSLEPTAAPTYRYDDVTKCHAVFNIKQDESRKDVTLTWDALEEDSNNPSIPPRSWINYEFTIGDGLETISATQIFVTNGTGTAQYTLTSAFVDIADGIKKVTFFAYYANPAINNGHPVWTTRTINCTIDTPEPTKSPTTDPTSQPTMSPTLGAVRIYLDSTACPDERCGCQSTIESDCCYTDCYQSWEIKPAPIIILSEKSASNTTFYVKRSVAEYPYSIEIEFNITAVTNELAKDYGFYKRMEEIKAGDFSVAYLNDSDNTETGNLTANEINVTYTIPDDCYFTEWDNKECEYYIDEKDRSLYQCSKENTGCSWCDFHEIPGPRCNDITPNEGKFIMPHTDVNDGGTFETSTFELSILTEGCDNECDWKGEVFLLELTSCRVYKNYKNLLSADQLNKLGATAGDVLNCTLLYPSRAYIIVVDQDPIVRTELIEIPDSSYEDWLWYVILGAVIVLAALSYIAYRWWVNKKMKEADVAQVEEDIDAVIEEQEEGWKAATDAQIAPANPLANIGGVQKPVDAHGAEYNPAGNTKIKDVADVNIEKFDERVEYGQQRGDDQFGDVV